MTAQMPLVPMIAVRVPSTSLNKDGKLSVLKDEVNLEGGDLTSWDHHGFGEHSGNQSFCLFIFSVQLNLRAHSLNQERPQGQRFLSIDTLARGALRYAHVRGDHLGSFEKCFGLSLTLAEEPTK